MVTETASTQPRNPDRERVYRTNKEVQPPVFAPKLPSFAYQFRREDDGYWIVQDIETGIFGHGEEVIDALTDFHIAAVQHLAVLEAEPTLSEELLWQREYLRARIPR